MFELLDIVPLQSTLGKELNEAISCPNPKLTTQNMATNKVRDFNGVIFFIAVKF
jgi:hypothetical protein